MIMKYTFFIVLALLTSCSHDFHGPYERLMKPVIEAKKAYPNMTFDGEVEPPMPDPEENKRTVLGVDVNRNGIRDDVEIFINRTHPDTNVRMALKQYVKAEVAFLNSAKLNNFKITMTALVKSGDAYVCMRFILPFDQSKMFNNVSDILYNEKFRDDAYGRSQSILGAASSPGVSSGEYLNYDKYCDFKINDYEKVREHFLKIYNESLRGIQNEKIKFK